MNTAIYPDAPIANSLEKGLAFQDFVCLKLAERHIVLQNIASRKYQFEVGENLQGFEIKLDAPCTRTGRLSVEVAEKSSRSVLFWTPSGIMRDDNAIVYIQGNYDCFWVFMKNWLLRYFENSQPRPEVTEFNGTVQRFFLPIADADIGAGWKWEREATNGR